MTDYTKIRIIIFQYILHIIIFVSAWEMWAWKGLFWTAIVYIFLIAAAGVTRDKLKKDDSDSSNK